MVDRNYLVYTLALLDEAEESGNTLHLSEAYSLAKKMVHNKIPFPGQLYDYVQKWNNRNVTDYAKHS